MAAPAVTICDVAPRDGLQTDALVLEPPVRAELVDRLAATGIPRVEAVARVGLGIVALVLLFSCARRIVDHVVEALHRPA